MHKSSIIILVMSKNSKNPTENVLGGISNYLSSHTPFSKSEAESTETSPSNTKTQQHNNITWVDIENPNNRVLAKLTEDYPFHPLHLDVNTLKQLPTIEKEEKYVFLLLYIPIYDAEQDKIVTNSLGIFLGKDYLVTAHDASASVIRKLFDVCEQDEQERGTFFNKSSSYLLYSLIKVLIEDLSNLTQSIVQELDTIEDKVFDTETSDAHAISRLRQKIIRLKRITSSLKGVLGDLAPNVSSFSTESLARYYSTNAKATNRLLETIEEARETIEIYKDADFTASTEKTNEILAVLTLIFTFTIPPTVIGTFFGMNILLPGGIETGAWSFLGQYTTLILVFMLSGVLVLSMYFYFKRKKWF